MTDDLISRADAVTELELLYDNQEPKEDPYNIGVRAAINFIKHKIPSAQPKQANDLISRADAIYELMNLARFRVDNETIIAGHMGAEALSAQPKQGEWVKRTHYILIAQVNFAYCSECGQPIMHEHTRPLWNFCPNCGARMTANADQHVQRVEYVENDERSRCWTCKHFERMHETPISSDGSYYTYVVCTAKECHYEPKDEPQTERSE